MVNEKLDWIVSNKFSQLTQHSIRILQGQSTGLLQADNKVDDWHGTVFVWNEFCVDAEDFLLAYIEHESLQLLCLISYVLGSFHHLEELSSIVLQEFWMVSAITNDHLLIINFI